MKNINKDLEFIKAFSKINISSICKELNVDRSNLLNNRTSQVNILKVKNEIMKRYNNLISKESE